MFVCLCEKSTPRSQASSGTPPRSPPPSDLYTRYIRHIFLCDSVEVKNKKRPPRHHDEVVSGTITMENNLNCKITLCYTRSDYKV